MSTGQGSAGGPPPTEEELRAAYEEEIKRVRLEHVLLENIVTLVNLGMRRTGLAPGTEGERDPEQVRLAIESVRALLPIVEPTAPAQSRAIRDALSQLQLAFVRIGGAPAPAGQPGTGTPASEGPGSPSSAGPPPGAGPPPPGAGPPPPGGPAEPERPRPGEPGPAQRSGRLWVPGH